jgi:hypothetical protein
MEQSTQSSSEMTPQLTPKWELTTPACVMCHAKWEETPIQLDMTRDTEVGASCSGKRDVPCKMGRGSSAVSPLNRYGAAADTKWELTAPACVMCHAKWEEAPRPSVPSIQLRMKLELSPKLELAAPAWVMCHANGKRLLGCQSPQSSSDTSAGQSSRVSGDEVGVSCWWSSKGHDVRNA